MDSVLMRLDAITTRLQRMETKLSKNGTDVVLGAQWGDEGKGKLVDMLSGDYDICARVAGGSNAGHTIIVEGRKYAFHLVPSGVLNKGTVCVIGNGVVVHVPSLLKELDALTVAGIDWEGRIKISDRAHLVFDFHQELDGAMEKGRGDKKIGTTKKGIGPAYASKIQRNGVRMGDLKYFDDFVERFGALVSQKRSFYFQVMATAILTESSVMGEAFEEQRAFRREVRSGGPLAADRRRGARAAC